MIIPSMLPAIIDLDSMNGDPLDDSMRIRFDCVAMEMIVMIRATRLDRKYETCDDVDNNCNRTVDDNAHHVYLDSDMMDMGPIKRSFYFYQAM